MASEELTAMRELLARLKAELADREAALPAHSIRPAQLLAIEELESQIQDLADRIKKLEAGAS